MKKSTAEVARLALIIIIAMAVAGCSRDPNVRKAKYFQSGVRYLEKDQLREADIEFQNALQIDPRFADAHFQLSQAYLKQGYWSGAYQELLRTVDLAPQNVKALTDLSKLLLAGHKFEDAHDRAKAALALDARNADAEMALADADIGMEDTQTGLAEAQKAIQMAPGRADCYLNLAMLQVKYDPNAVEPTLLKAVSVDPNFLPARLSLGQFYQAHQRWADAEAQFRAAIASKPGFPAPRAALASLYLAQGRKSDAEQTLNEAKTALANNPTGYRMLGDFYVSTGDTAKALQEFASLRESHPKDLVVKRTYIQLLITDNQIPEAEKLNNEILKGDPQDTGALLLEAEILDRNHRANDAVPVLQSILKNAPDNALAHYELGQVFNEVGNTAEAEAEWHNASRLVPTFVEPQRALAALSLRQSEWDQLSTIADGLIHAEPWSAEGYAFRAAADFARGDQTGAEASLLKAQEVAPKDARVYTGLAELRSAQKKTDDAESLYRHALELDPNSITALRGIVGIEVQRKQSGDALKTVQAQIEKSPSNSNFQLLLGQLYITLNDQGNAATAFQKAIDLDKTNIDAYTLLAAVHARQGQTDQAVNIYRTAIQVNPGDVRLYLGEGSIQENRGNWQAAEQLYQKAMDLRPDFPLAANNLAYLMIEHDGNKDVALTLAQTARRGLPNLPNTADTLAWAYYSKGVYNSAIDLLQEAVKQSPNDATFRYHLGMAYAKNNDLAHAREELQKALKLDTNGSKSSDIKKALAEYAGA
jgi:cellulose synthase operon protein C